MKKPINDPLLIEEIYTEQLHSINNDKKVTWKKEQEYYQIVKEATQIKNKFNSVKS